MSIPIETAEDWHATKALPQLAGRYLRLGAVSEFLIKDSIRGRDMNLRKQILKIWDLVDDFKEYCSKSKGWNVCENDDLIEAENEYHRFIWINRLYPNTFKRVIGNPLCYFREGISLRAVRLSYMAWVLPAAPSESITKSIAEEPQRSRKIAICDLSEAYTSRPICSKLNETKSVVFHEFEKFLSIEYGIELLPIYKLPSLPPEFVPLQPEKLGLGN